MKYNALIIALVILTSIIPVNASNYITIILEFKENVKSIDGIAMLHKYDLIILKELKYVFNGYIAKIKAEQIERLKQEDIIKNIYIDESIKIKRNLKNLEAIGINGNVRYDGMNVTGKGVIVAVIDTGVDYTHNDLKGFGYDKKVIGGYDFLNKDEDPRDNDGHGTMVAGIIAANGIIKGVAPDSKIIAYKIASGDRYVSTSEMISAIEKAAEDGANIVNISIGLDHINEAIDNAINNIVDKGIAVVAAAGNDGEKGLSSIKSVGSALKAITVGATLIDVEEPLFATVKVIDDGRIFHAIPMADSISTSVQGKLVFVNYAREEDVKDLNLTNTIALAERGGAIKIVDGKEQRELVYFSEKEYNVANKGARAIIVYNNEPGIFRGKLIHENNKQDYKPRIAAVSLSREDGLLLRQLLEEKKELMIELKVYSDPNIVADFSSKGPVSPFYIKPDLVAPGVMINSTYINNSYSISSGTSFAAPHVSGAAALLLQLHPNLKPQEIASILTTTADPLLDPYGNYYSVDVAGAGRLNVTRAINSNIIALPNYAILYLSPTMNGNKIINLKAINGVIEDINATVKLFSPNNIDIKLDVKKVGNDTQLLISAYSNNLTNNRYEGRIYINAMNQQITIPLIIYTSTIGINTVNENGKISLSINYDKDWEAAKVKIINPKNEFRIVTLTPINNMIDIKADELGEHWIDVSIISKNEIIKGFATLNVNNINNIDMIYLDNIIPPKQMLIIFGFLSVISIIIILIKNMYKKEKRIIDDFY